MKNTGFLVLCSFSVFVCIIIGMFVYVIVAKLVQLQRKTAWDWIGTNSNGERV